MIRTSDPALVNRLVQRDYPDADMTEALIEPLHVCLIEGDNGAIFMWRGPGIYEAHVFFACRGREALEFARRLIEMMRGEYGARLFWALVPVESRKVRMFVRHVGWKSQGLVTTKDGPNELFVSENVQCLQQ